jgi:ATP-dependent DNA helicase RecG
MVKPRSHSTDSRRMMERAVEVMRQSVPERRADGSPSPKVGAVLVRPDGSEVTAARGELREGNHAEYILLERKCLGERLDGSVLFTTLEPCLDRNQPKRGCARHIVSARIREVYVGVEDDNPAVAGKGIEHLRRAGATVRMFDRDLQEVILAENQAFFEWARRQLPKPADVPIRLSVYEDPVGAVELDDLSLDALNRYRTAQGVESAADSPEFHRLLRQQGLLIEQDGVTRPSGFGLLLFGKRPRNAVPQAGLLARADLPDGTSARREFGEALVLIPRLLEDWLRTVLPSTIDRSRMERKERVDLPFEMIREAVVNALIHRNYDLSGEKCQLVVDAETIRVKSPGGPVPPITLEQLNSFSAPMKSRNPQLHYVFARMGLAEEQGFGLTMTLKRDAEKLGLPLPSYSMEGDYLVLTLYRSIAAAKSSLSSEMKAQLTKAELAAWEWFSTKDRVTTADYQEALGLPNRTAKNHISKFVELGLLRRQGAGPATFYEVVRP